MMAESFALLWWRCAGLLKYVNPIPPLSIASTLESRMKKRNEVMHNEGLDEDHNVRHDDYR
jgi:hypothetical protein